MSINFLKFIKISAKMHPGVYVHVTCNLIFLSLMNLLPHLNQKKPLIIHHSVSAY